MNRMSLLSVLAVSLLSYCVAAADISVSPTRAGSTYRNSAGTPLNVFAREPYSPLFLVHGGTNIHRGFMVFDLSSVPAGATLTSVSFDFVQQAVGAPTVEIWGNYQPGELAYDTYFGLQGLGWWTQVYADDAPFASMTTDGSLFGQIALNGSSGNGTPVSVALSNNGGLAYFQSQIGNEVLLISRLWGDMDGYYGQHGADGGGYPTLEIGYIIPEPASLGLLACAALLRRRSW